MEMTRDRNGNEERVKGRRGMRNRERRKKVQETREGKRDQST